jgi:transposase-like protein
MVRIGYIDTVHGICPHCDEDTLLVAIVTDFYKCTSCGEETRQYVNGSIKYLKLDDKDRAFVERMKLNEEQDGEER